MLIRRRHFLKHTTVAAAGSLLVPRFLHSMPQQAGLSGQRILIMIQLSGGNDGLNTVIPLGNDIYYRQRPTLAVPADKALRLQDGAGLHPSLTVFRNLYEKGELAILNNVGYPDPDRSHFRSMDIWHSASPAGSYWDTGWLGRYLDTVAVTGAPPLQVLELDESASLATRGQLHKALAFDDPGRLFNSSQSPFFKQLAAQQHAMEHEAVPAYLYRTLADTVESADEIFKASKTGASTASYPDTGLARQLKTVASLIKGGLATSVYYLNLGSFDTHINQAGQQSRLLAELNGAVYAFVTDLKIQNRFNDVLIATFSEFGRRVAQNASAGTDHGTANQMFFIGGQLRQPGLMNALPDLTNLDNGDLRFNVDFRRVYSNLLEGWLQTDAKAVLKGHFEPIQIV